MPKIKEQNVLVTGGAGFIGSHVTYEISKTNPKSLFVVDNLFLGRKENLDITKKIYPNLKLFVESVTDYDKIKSIIIKNNINVIFNLAVIPLPVSFTDPGLTCIQNVNSVINLCELARKKYFDTLIQCSTSEVYGTAQNVPMGEDHPYLPSTPYAASKLAGDQICLSYEKLFGLDLSIVRPFNNYGPNQNDGKYAGIIPIIVKNILQGENIRINGNGEQTRDYNYVKDTARAFIDVYENKNTRTKILNIGSGIEISINDIVDLVLKKMKAKNTKIEYVDPRAGDVMRHCAKITLAKDMIDFKPSVNIEDGVEKTVQWYSQKLLGV